VNRHGRTSHFITRIERFSHRMHNKAMIADNQLAIVGGRNLGDEYFSASPTVRGAHCTGPNTTVLAKLTVCLATVRLPSGSSQ